MHMDSEPPFSLSDYSLEDCDWEDLYAILSDGDYTHETSSNCDQEQFPQNANNFQDSGTAASNSSSHPMSSLTVAHHGEKQPVSRKRYSREELLNLIQGVEEHMHRYYRWEHIKKKYFADSNRSASQLKHKWKHFMEKIKKMGDIKDQDLGLREFYIKAQKADDAKRATEKVHRRHCTAYI